MLWITVRKSRAGIIYLQPDGVDTRYGDLRDRPLEQSCLFCGEWLVPNAIWLIRMPRDVLFAQWGTGLIIFGIVIRLIRRAVPQDIADSIITVSR